MIIALFKHDYITESLRLRSRLAVRSNEDPKHTVETATSPKRLSASDIKRQARNAAAGKLVHHHRPPTFTSSNIRLLLNCIYPTNVIPLQPTPLSSRVPSSPAQTNSRDGKRVSPTTAPPPIHRTLRFPTTNALFRSPRSHCVGYMTDGLTRNLGSV